MCVKKKTVIEPDYDSPDVIVQCTELFVVTKETYVMVSVNYIAYIHRDGMRQYRLNSGKNNRLIKGHKQYIGQNVSVEFILDKVKLQIPWSFDSIAVCHNNTGESNHIGLNGICEVEIIDSSKLTNAFAANEQITADKLRQKYLSTMKTVSEPVLNRFFSGNRISVFNINALIMPLRDFMSEQLRDNEILGNMGLCVTDLKLNFIRVNNGQS